MSKTPESLTDLLDRAEALVGVMKDAHPGLATWVQALCSLSQQVHDEIHAKIAIQPAAGEPDNDE